MLRCWMSSQLCSLSLFTVFSFFFLEEVWVGSEVEGNKKEMWWLEQLTAHWFTPRILKFFKLGSSPWLSPWQTLDSVLAWRAAQIPFDLVASQSGFFWEKEMRSWLPWIPSSRFLHSQAPLPTKFSESWDFQSCTKLYIVGTFLQPILRRANIDIVLFMRDSPGTCNHYLPFTAMETETEKVK